MNYSEVIFRVILAGSLVFCVHYGFNIGVLASLVVSHFVMWLIFSNFWAAILFGIPSLTNPGRTRTKAFLVTLANYSRFFKGVECVLIYGSLSRGMWHDQSDIDMRVQFKRSLSGILSGLTFVYLARLFAFIQRQPLDLFGSDGIEFLNKMREDEVPVCISGVCPSNVRCTQWNNNLL